MSSKAVCDVSIEDERSRDAIGGDGAIELNNLKDFDFESDAKEIESNISIISDKKQKGNNEVGKNVILNVSTTSKPFYIPRSSVAKFPRPTMDQKVTQKKIARIWSTQK